MNIQIRKTDYGHHYDIESFVSKVYKTLANLSKVLSFETNLIWYCRGFLICFTMQFFHF